MPDVVKRRQVGSAGRPLRIVVLGSSAVFMMVPRPETPNESVYAELLPELLLDRGVNAHVWVHAQWHATVREVLPNWERWVNDHMPDLVIINLGMAEAQPRVVPTWLLRNTMTWLPGMSETAQIYRRRVVPRLRPLVRDVQRRLAGSAGLWASRVPPERFVRTMRRMVGMATREHRAVVLLLDIDPVNDRLEHWYPGLGLRRLAYNMLIQRVADEFPLAFVAHASEVVTADNRDDVLPDGLHRSALGHRLVAERLADEVIRRAQLLGLQP